MKKGFTLVELSIVLVIIGLLIGGILVAQSMSETAKISAQIRQIGQFDAAVANFITKYNSVPGDSPQFGGNGTGIIGDRSNVNPPTTDSVWWDTNSQNDIARFWVQLGESGFMPGANFTATIPATGFDISSSTPNAPKSALDSKSGVIAGAALVYDSVGQTSMTVYEIADYSPMMPTGGTNSPQAYGHTSITPNQIIAIEEKMDGDMVPISGPVGARGMTQGDGNGNNLCGGCFHFGSDGPVSPCTFNNWLKYIPGNSRSCALVIQVMSGSGGMPIRGTKY